MNVTIEIGLSNHEAIEAMQARLVNSRFRKDFEARAAAAILDIIGDSCQEFETAAEVNVITNDWPPVVFAGFELAEEN